MKRSAKRQKGRPSSVKRKVSPPARRTRRSPSSTLRASHDAALRKDTAAGAEYRLLITPRFNEREQKHKTLFLLETTQQFSSFRYDLSVEEQIEGKQLHYSILGLKTPLLSLPSSGRAQYTREYGDLLGTYEVKVTGLDGSTSSFAVRIAPERVTLIKKPSKGFIEVSVDKALWSFT
jgi:hypothetical protein